MPKPPGEGSLQLTGTLSTIAITSQHNTLAEFKAVRAGALWCFQPWWWQVLDRTDEIVADLAAIFHPELFPGHVFKHFLKLPRRTNKLNKENNSIMKGA